MDPVFISFFEKKIYFLIMGICLWICAHVRRFLWKPEEGVECHGAGIIGSCEPPDIGAGNQTWGSARAVCTLSL